jgi:Dolichyl-phosphate-mannose-protein mannosyltransferase
MTDNSLSPPRDYVRAVAWVVIALGLAIRLMIAIQPIERLLPICLADDTFYYLRIAENIVAGNGPSFDGEIATNGFHPLWMLASMAAVALGKGAHGGARLLLLLLAGIGGLNALLLWRLARRGLPPGAALWALVAWTLSPFVIMTEMMGVEAPLMVLFALLVLNRYAAIREADQPSTRAWVGLGVWLGLALLARTDAVLLGAVLALDVAATRLWPARREVARLKQELGRALVGAGAALATVLPWALFNLIRFGGVTQDSARALIARERGWLELAGEPLGAKLLGQTKMGFADYLIRLAGMPNAALALGLAGVLGGAALATLLLRREPGARRVWPAVRLPLLWGGAVWAFYLLYFWQQKYWYFFPVELALALAGAGVVAVVEAAATRRRAGAWVLGVAAAALLYGYAVSGAGIWKNGFQPWQRAYPEVAAVLRAMADKQPDLKFGAFNAGIVSAWSQLPVVNLDGVVNPRATEALENRRFLAYLHEAGIDVIGDHQPLIAAYGAFAGGDWTQAFTLVTTIPTHSSQGDMLVLRLKQPVNGAE